MDMLMVRDIIKRNDRITSIQKNLFRKIDNKMNILILIGCDKEFFREDALLIMKPKK